MDDYSEQIGIVIENKINSKAAITKWNNLLSNIIIKEKTLPTAVKPLLKTTWSQDPYYNDLCPKTANNVPTVTGCVATAMAQAMKYWNYPTTGSGSNSYTSKTLSLPSSANFGTTTYNWANMLNNINSANSEIAKLMFHCGVAINMNYGTAASGGSSAYLYGSYPSAEYALKNYFGYPSSLKFVNKSSYSTDALWLDVLKTELIAARVIIYQGFSSTSSNASGHCFVADGFDINNFIHFNWGWGGSYDGYFSVASLIPSGSGTGGGAGNYTSNQGALIGLRPPTTSAPVADFSATSTITNVGSTVTLSDLSTNIPNSWTWTITPATFTFVNGTSNNSKFPEVSFTANGQYSITLNATNSIGTGSLTKTAYIIVNPALASQVCDTLTNFSSTDQKVNYSINGGGYMAGHNVSKLKGYAEYYATYTPYTHISGVVIDFAHAEASNSTNTISVNLYSNVSNKPSAILISKTVKIIDIVNDVNNNKPTTVLFNTPYQLTGPFYVGYTLTYATGDTVSVYTGKSGAISTNTAFFQYNNGTWRDYKSGWGENQHLKISPMISTMPTPNFTINSSPEFVNTNVIVDASSSVGAYEYNWTIANANITSSKFYQETISYTTPGTYNIILDVTGGCGTTKQITKQIIINSNCTSAPAAPGAISGITSVCPGSINVTYTVAAISGASSYTWTLPTGITGTSTTNSITVNISNTIQSGSITVSAVNSCGTSAVSSLSITPLNKPTPNFNSVNAVCSGTIIPSLPSQSINGINGQWTPTINNTTTTPYTFTPTSGQCATTATLTITINPLPTVKAIASSTTIYEGQSVTLTGSGAQSYTWNNGVINAVAFKPLVGAITYTVTGTGANNCTNTANVLVTVLSSASLEDLKLNNSFNAYVNNSTDELIINATIDKTSNIIVTLINSAGQEIYNQKYTSYLGDFNSIINVNRFQTGVYILKMDTNQGVISKKLVVN